MKIAVLVKQVPGSDSPLPLNSNQSWLDENGISYVMNECDNYALEEALQIKEENGDGEVVVISLGPDRVQKVIREGLAKGADRAIHIQMNSDGIADPLSLGTLFADAIRDEKFDLIFSGLQSDDLGMGQTGIIIGEMLGMSTASLAMATELSEGIIKVKRELEAGFFQWVSMSLPASITIQSGLNTPRYPSLKGIMGAKKKEINIVTPGGHDVKQSAKKVYVPQSDKQTVMIEGSVDQIVDKLIEAFRNEIKVI
jgi:electron transfer flavoprotein beta subunit